MPAAAADGLHEATSVGPVSTVLHVIVSQPFVMSPICGVQLATPTGPVATVLHVTPAPVPLGPLGVQVATLVVAPARVLQYVAVKPLPAFAGAAVQEATSDQLGTGGLVVQAVAVYALPEFAADAEQLATSVGPVVTVAHVVVT